MFNPASPWMAADGLYNLRLHHRRERPLLEENLNGPAGDRPPPHRPTANMAGIGWTGCDRGGRATAGAEAPNFKHQAPEKIQ